MYSLVLVQGKKEQAIRLLPEDRQHLQHLLRAFTASERRALHPTAGLHHAVLSRTSDFRLKPLSLSTVAQAFHQDEPVRPTSGRRTLTQSRMVTDSISSIRV